MNRHSLSIGEAMIETAGGARGVDGWAWLETPSKNETGNKAIKV